MLLFANQFSRFIFFAPLLYSSNILKSNFNEDKELNFSIGINLSSKAERSKTLKSKSIILFLLIES